MQPDLQSDPKSGWQTGWRTVARDALIIMVIRGALGYVATLLAGPGNVFATGLLDLVILSIGFCASGYLAREQPMRHLGLVAGGVWLLSGIDVLRPASPLTLTIWLLGSILVAAAALIGWLGCRLIARRSPSEPPNSGP